MELQCLTNDASQFRMAQQTCAVALVEPLLHAAAVMVPILMLRGIVPRLRVTIQPRVEFLLKGGGQFRRNGIRRAKGDEIRAAILLPVRQPIGRAPVFSRWLEWLEDHRGAALLPAAVKFNREADYSPTRRALKWCFARV